MIHRIYASDKRFKAVSFTAGLNVILAEMNQESSEKDSRNGLGKTTLINVMHFCFGSDLKKKNLPVDNIEDWIFYIEFDLSGSKVIAGRGINDTGIIKIEGDCSNFPLPVEIDEDGGFDYYKILDWKKLLGISLFGLTSTSRKKHIPSFRALISYFLRSGIDAYSKPFIYFRSQPPWNIQVHNAYLLGLNWDHVSATQEIKDKSKAIKSLNDAVNTGIISSQGELEAERVSLQSALDKEKIALDSFHVHPQYKDIQDKANSLTQTIHDLSNKDLVLNRKLERYEESVRSEHSPDNNVVTDLYEEAGLYFGEAVKKTLDEAKVFHDQIVQNRKLFLETEIQEIKNSINTNDDLIKSSMAKRADLLKILKTQGALDEFSLLQERVVEKKSELENIKSKISAIQEMTSRKKEVKAEKIELETKLQRDYEQSRPLWEKSVAKFNENSLALYNESGNLIIDVSDNGYSFDVEIPRSSSEGVGRMKIFCYDLMLVELFSKRDKINFLVHDSTIFDGVDSRQVAHALEYAHKTGIEDDFQYICAFNSDQLPTEYFSEGFKISDFVRLKLHDKNPQDSLMGFKYNET